MKKSTVDGYKSKKPETIAYFISKGLEWLANQLFNARLELKETNDALKHKQAELWSERAKHEVDDLIEKENETLKDVLQDNGIRPRKLIVSYTVEDCKNCECKDDDEGYDCFATQEYGDCPQKTVTKSISFYAFEINEGILSGITSKFEKMEDVNLLEVTDAKTGKCLYKYEPKEVDT